MLRQTISSDDLSIEWSRRLHRGVYGIRSDNAAEEKQCLIDCDCLRKSLRLTGMRQCVNERIFQL